MGSKSYNDIISWLYQTIDEESEKPENEMDINLIAECSEYLDELTAKENTFSEKELSNIKQRIKNRHKIETPRKSKKFFYLKIGIAMLVIITAFSGITIPAKMSGYSSAWDLIKNNFIEIFNLEDKNKIDTEGISVIKNSAHKKYETLEELLREEQLNIFYPTVLPHDLKIKSVIIYERSEDNFILTFNTDSDILSVSVSNKYISELEFADDTHSTEYLNFYIRIDDNGTYSAVAQKGGYEYNIIYNNYEELVKILDGMKGMD